MNHPASSSPPPRSFWPHAIVGWFIVFIAAMASWVAVAMRQDMDLVGADYYDQEIRYQEQIERLTRTHEISSQTRIGYEALEGAIVIALPMSHESARGTIRLYRPSDAKLDREIAVTLGADGTQRLRATELQPGLWKVQVRWEAGGSDYYIDRSVLIPAGASIRN